MNQPADHDDKLRQLLDALVDNRLDEATTMQLRQSLRDDARARSYFCEFMALNSQLGLLFAQPLAIPNLPSHGPEFQPAGPVVLPPLTVSQSIQGSFLRSILRATSRSVIAATLLVATILYGSFSFIVWQMSRHELASHTSFDVVHDHLTTPPTVSSVARVIEAHDCRWRAKSLVPTDGEWLKPGVLRLASGVVHLEFKDGARVALDGPCEFELRSASSGFLHSGALLAHVPRQAIGFQIQTQSATVVDLGTEFGLQTDAQNVTQVYVFQGKVELRPDNRQSLASGQPSITLTAGMARRVEPANEKGLSVVQSIDLTRQPFNPPRPALIETQIRVEGAIASSAFPLCEAQRLIDGSGLNENKHGNDPEGSMWLSQPGKPSEAFVLFDLVRPYRLASMKVWNYNEPELGPSRGVKQADIYVSISGKGTPRSHPQEWKLVVADQPFMPAPGTPDLAEFDIVQLNNVEARFVAIMIDASFGPDPRGDPKTYVGLSEVQFFGRRIPARDSKQPPQP